MSMEDWRSEYVEPPVRRRKAERVMLVIHAMSDRFIGNAFDSMSGHFRPETEAAVTPVRQTQPDVGVGYTEHYDVAKATQEP